MPTAESLVQVADDNGVAVVRLGSQETGSALNTEMCRAIIDALETAADGGADAAVVTGTGRFFSTGGDLKTLKEWSSWPTLKRRDWLHNGPQAVGRTLTTIPIPVVAAVNGPAFGAGLDLALACDLRVAASSARFCAAYVNLGVIPGDGGAWLLPHLIGAGPAMDLLLTGRVVDADEALRLGLVTRVVADDVVLPDAVDLARTLGGKPGQATTAIRQAVHAASTQSFIQHLEYAGLLMDAIAGSQEHAEAVERLLDR